MSRTLTAAQQRAVRWYIGDVEGQDPFWGDARAYVTLNALFFPELAAERARAAEGKRLNPAILADGNRLSAVLTELLAAFTPLPEQQMTFRVERSADFEQMQHAGKTISFTSSSTAGFLPAYQDRIGITLMRFLLPAGTPCIRMAQALAHYAKADEAEVLLPPGLPLRFSVLPLTDPEQRILDAKGAPPVCSVMAEPVIPQRTPKRMTSLPDCPAPQVLEALNQGKEPDPKALASFLRWKEAVQGSWGD